MIMGVRETLIGNTVYENITLYVKLFKYLGAS